MTGIKRPHDTVILERRFFAKGTNILREGEDGSSAYLIQSGSVMIYSIHNERKIVLANLGVGDIFGETSLILNTVRTASVEALEDCNLIVITRQVLKDKMDKSDPTIRALLQMLMRRLQQGNDSLMGKRPTIEDMQEGLVFIYEKMITELPKTDKPHFRQEVLPLIEEINNKLSQYKALIK